MLTIALDPKLQDTITIFLGIIVEAIPFLILGIIVSNLLAVFIKQEWLLKLVGKNRVLSHLASALMGMIFPVCECGNVPVTRQLLAKGLSVSQAISFYLGSPILNFVVIASTISAFGGQPIIIIARFVGGLIIATLVGIILSFFKDEDQFLSKAALAEKEAEHDHAHHVVKDRFKTLFRRHNLQLAIKEFLEMASFLAIGAAIAAITQTWIPRDYVFALNSAPILAITAMIILAVIISVCSTVDAFVGLSYAAVLSPSAVLAFLLYGPMIDLKAISMLLSTFKPKLVVILISLVTVFTLIITLGLSASGY